MGLLTAIKIVKVAKKARLYYRAYRHYRKRVKMGQGKADALVATAIDFHLPVDELFNWMKKHSGDFGEVGRDQLSYPQKATEVRKK